MGKFFLKAVFVTFTFAAAGCSSLTPPLVSGGADAEDAPAEEASPESSRGPSAPPEEVSPAASAEGLPDETAAVAFAEAASEGGLGEEALEKILSEESLTITSLLLNHNSSGTVIIARGENNTGLDIASLTLSFAAWDSADLPLEIGFAGRDASYIAESVIENADIKDGRMFRKEVTLEGVRDDIDTLKVAVVSYTDTGGVAHENPYYGAFRSLYEGKALEPPLHTVGRGMFIN